MVWFEYAGERKAGENLENVERGVYVVAFGNAIFPPSRVFFCLATNLSDWVPPPWNFWTFFWPFYLLLMTLITLVK